MHTLRTSFPARALIVSLVVFCAPLAALAQFTPGYSHTSTPNSTNLNNGYYEYTYVGGCGVNGSQSCSTDQLTDFEHVTSPIGRYVPTLVTDAWTNGHVGYDSSATTFNAGPDYCTNENNGTATNYQGQFVCTGSGAFASGFPKGYYYKDNTGNFTYRPTAARLCGIADTYDAANGAPWGKCTVQNSDGTVSIIPCTPDSPAPDVYGTVYKQLSSGVQTILPVGDYSYSGNSDKSNFAFDGSLWYLIQDSHHYYIPNYYGQSTGNPGDTNDTISYLYCSTSNLPKNTLTPSVTSTSTLAPITLTWSDLALQDNSLFASNPTGTGSISGNLSGPSAVQCTFSANPADPNFTTIPTYTYSGHTVGVSTGTVTVNPQVNTTYTYTCTGNNGTTQAWANIEVLPATTQPNVQLYVNGQRNTQQNPAVVVPANSPLNFTWTSQYATSCYADTPNWTYTGGAPQSPNGGVNGGNAPSAGTASYTIRCYDGPVSPSTPQTTDTVKITVPGTIVGYCKEKDPTLGAYPYNSYNWFAYEDGAVGTPTYAWTLPGTYSTTGAGTSNVTTTYANSATYPGNSVVIGDTNGDTPVTVSCPNAVVATNPCSASPNPQLVNKNVTWSTSITHDGLVIYSFQWSFPGATTVSGTQDSSDTTTYATPGPYMGTLYATAGGFFSGNDYQCSAQETIASGACYGDGCSSQGIGGTCTDTTLCCSSTAGVCPSVTCKASVPTAVVVGQKSQINWSSTYAASCTGTGFTPTPPATAGPWTVQPTVNDIPTARYDIQCQSATAGDISHSNLSKTCEDTVTVSQPSSAISASPSAVNKGGATQLSWSATNNTSATWSCSVTANGATIVGPQSVTAGNTWSTIASPYSATNINSPTTYKLTCTGIAGNSSASTLVTVLPAFTPF